MKHTVNIFGEMHTKSDRDRVEKEIIDLFRQGKVKYLLSEEIGDNVAMTSDAAKRLMKGNNFSISNRSYKLAIKLAIPVIGIDDWDDIVFKKDKKDKDGNYVDCSVSFAIREMNMVNVIKKYGALGDCAVIVGDSHLREEPNEVMGDPSIINKKFREDPNVKIFRSPIGEVK